MENATWNFVIAGPPFVKIIIMPMPSRGDCVHCCPSRSSYSLMMNTKRKVHHFDGSMEHLCRCVRHIDGHSNLISITLRILGAC
ncbi:hypothetical protein OUZ56_006336 [Daphnia magna]|uniref:Uncharacterized protein n=1 Tax=Daphnia magna TaxID=35525 RepID=A0ABQ9YVD5_9CRUS|nr:hypothetical protein OUZ56_006336 [Daphnia magna]